MLALPEEKLSSIPAELNGDHAAKEYVVPVFDRFDLLFPLSKYSSAERSGFAELLAGYLPALSERYDILILDLPAGAEEQENLDFLPLVETLIVVTNPEPAAHVAAGHYVKRALGYIEPERIRFWHNRYQGFQSISFQPNDVIGNYNRNMPTDEHIDPQQIHIQHAAFVPDDASLDLLQGDPAVMLQLLRNLSGTIDALHETMLSEIPIGVSFSPHLMAQIRFFLRNCGGGEQTAEGLMEEFGTYLRRLLGAAAGSAPGKRTPLFTADEERALSNYFSRYLANATLTQLRKAFSLVEKKREAEEDRLSGFGGNGAGKDPARGLERELSALLLYLEEEVWVSRTLKNPSGLLMFQFALYKLFQSEKIRGVLESFIPRTRDGHSRLLRDRYTQISRLIEGSDQYRREYIALIKKLFPLILRQVELLSSTFEINDLLFKNEDGKLDRKVYARLTSGFVHEAINSGLGIMVSFSHRPASVAFEKAASTLLAE
jgi:flagellar biosynthesis protein FlhG